MYLRRAVLFTRLQFERHCASYGNDVAVFACVARAVREHYFSVAR